MFGINNFEICKLFKKQVISHHLSQLLNELNKNKSNMCFSLARNVGFEMPWMIFNIVVKKLQTRKAFYNNKPVGYGEDKFLISSGIDLHANPNGEKGDHVSTNEINMFSDCSTGLPKKDGSAETILGSFFSLLLSFRVPCRPKLAYFCALSFSNTQLNA